MPFSSPTNLICRRMMVLRSKVVYFTGAVEDEFDDEAPAVIEA